MKFEYNHQQNAMLNHASYLLTYLLIYPALFQRYCRFLCSWPHPYSTRILGMLPLHQIAHVECQLEHKPNQPWNYVRSIPT